KTTSEGKRYYDRIVKRFGDREVVFLLIPHEVRDDPQTFYMMENKVSHGLFKAVSEDPAFQDELARLKEKYKAVPRMEWEAWNQGDEYDPNLPVFRVNVLEAYCFALCVGGKLPMETQWDAAAGKGRADAPYLDPNGKPLEDGEVAVGRKAPMPVGTAKR